MEQSVSTTFMSGFALGLSLIMAIGAQNAFVLRQGIRQEYVMAVCLICALSDAILVAFGIFGFRIISHYIPFLQFFIRVVGAVYLCIYGLKCLYLAWKSREALNPSSKTSVSLGAIVATCVAFTWLNPHVYLDTVFLIGSISTNYPRMEQWFAFGAILASFFFFFSLGYGARILRPFFASSNSWRVLELIIGITMLWIALRLVLPLTH